jgi:hypothetical protein
VKTLCVYLRFECPILRESYRSSAVQFWHDKDRCIGSNQTGISKTQVPRNPSKSDRLSVQCPSGSGLSQSTYIGMTITSNLITAMVGLFGMFLVRKRMKKLINTSLSDYFHNRYQQNLARQIRARKTFVSMRENRLQEGAQSEIYFDTEEQFVV